MIAAAGISPPPYANAAIGTRLRPGARKAFLTDLASARFTVANLEIGDYFTVRGLERGYAGLNLSLVDKSVIVLAARYRTRRIMTIDERHFRAVTPLDGGTFTILPAVAREPQPDRSDVTDPSSS